MLAMRIRNVLALHAYQQEHQNLNILQPQEMASANHSEDPKRQMGTSADTLFQPDGALSGKASHTVLRH